MKGKERAYNAREVMQLDIAQVLQRLYLDAKAREELDDWTKKEDYFLDSGNDQRDEATHENDECE